MATIRAVTLATLLSTGSNISDIPGNDTSGDTGGDAACNITGGDSNSGTSGDIASGTGDDSSANSIDFTSSSGITAALMTKQKMSLERVLATSLAISLAVKQELWSYCY